MEQKIKLAMIGGGPDSFIGAVHRIAARLDNLYELVAGCFSSAYEKSVQTGLELGLTSTRIYPSYQDLIRQESELPAELRAQVICIVTPNHLHYAAARMALEMGFHVILDKPMTMTLAEAQLLKAVQGASGKELLLTHTYTGYPMIKEARALIAAGQLGEIRKVYVEYPQGWLSSQTSSKQADWRTDPAKSGIAGAMGDIGTHAFNLVEYSSSLRITKLCAAIQTVVENRRLDDDGAILFELENGATGVLIASQVLTGEENKLKIRLYGTLGGIEWQQDQANSLLVKYADRPSEIRRTGGTYISAAAQHNTRLPAGHPEGYLEAFANLYRNFGQTLLARAQGEIPSPESLDFPSVDEGIRGMAFIEAAIASGASDQKWTLVNINI